MSITLEDIVAIQHDQLNTLSRKIIYLMMRNQANELGWATISENDFSEASALPRRSVIAVIKHLISTGMVERRKSGPTHSSPYQYRIITL
jgi:predicted transcriptional regulator